MSKYSVISQKLTQGKENKLKPCAQVDKKKPRKRRLNQADKRSLLKLQAEKESLSTKEFARLLRGRVDIFGSTLLIHAIINGKERLAAGIIDLDEDGASFGTRDFYGSTPLLLAYKNGLLSIVKRLKSQLGKCAIHQTDQSGSNSLFWAALLRDNPSLTDLLKHRAQHPEAQSLYEKTITPHDILTAPKNSYAEIKHQLKPLCRNLNIETTSTKLSIQAEAFCQWRNTNLVLPTLTDAFVLNKKRPAPSPSARINHNELWSKRKKVINSDLNTDTIVDVKTSSHQLPVKFLYHVLDYFRRNDKWRMEHYSWVKPNQLQDARFFWSLCEDAQHKQLIIDAYQSDGPELSEPNDNTPLLL